MPLTVDGITYHSMAEVLTALGISRATLWRWRSEHKIPQGSRLRGKVLFSANDLAAIRDYALRVEPISGSTREQLRLFGPQR
jgi:predicted DNA-binding transcriptional regulator AlpA